MPTARRLTVHTEQVRAFAVLSQADLPAVAAAVLTAGGQRYTYLRGLANAATGEALTPAHAFDLASLTKVLVTLPEVLALLAEHKLDLSTRVGDVLPECGWGQSGGLKQQSVAALLSHTSGLAAWAPLYLYPASRATLLQRVLQESHWYVGPPGSVVYSDLGFMVLGLMVERLRAQPLAALAAQRGPLRFNPPPAQPCVATEQDPWRERLLQGEVHDENAFALGGVSGHAGAFGTLEQVAEVVQGYLQETLLPAVVLRLAQQPYAQEGAMRRGLGWQLGHPQSFGGAQCSREGYGHTGFTGTSVWLEPQRGYAAVLLTNRVHPSRHTRPGEIVKLRRAFHDAVHHELA